MKFPTEFNFGHIKYQILRIPEMRDNEGNELGGMHRQHDGKIYVIDDDHTDEYRRHVLMHEIIHAIEVCQGMEALKDEQVHGLAFGIIQALQQNPWMKEFFSED